MTAQGNALGANRKCPPVALKGRDSRCVPVTASAIPPFQGILIIKPSNTQGVALGYRISAFQA
jgi:hypothetical protein